MTGENARGFGWLSWREKEQCDRPVNTYTLNEHNVHIILEFNKLTSYCSM